MLQLQRLPLKPGLSATSNRTAPQWQLPSWRTVEGVVVTAGLVFDFAMLLSFLELREGVYPTLLTALCQF
jgi:hypothetical protein